MDIYMIATLYNGEQRVGFRVLDLDSKKLLDVKEDAVISVIKAGNKIHNLKLENGKIRGSNGDLERYTKISGNTQLNGCGALVVLNQLSDVGYLVTNYTGQIKRLKNEDAIKYASMYGIANGKVVNKDGKSYISAISGTYKVVDIPVQKPVEVKKPVQAEPEKQVEPKGSEAEPKGSEAEPKGSETKPKSSEVELSFTPEQIGVLQGYYNWANLDNETTEKELKHLDEVIKSGKLKEEYNKTPLLNEFITQLGTPIAIGEIFGNELGSKLIGFISTGLPFTESLVHKVVDTLSKSIETFYCRIFYKFKDTIQNIFMATTDTFRVGARIYLEYMVKKECLGAYKDFDTTSEKHLKEMIKRYALCSKYTFTEMRALVGELDLLNEFRSTVKMNLYPVGFSKHGQELACIALKYYNQSTGDSSHDERIALVDIFVSYPMFYDKEFIMDKYGSDIHHLFLEESPFEEYGNCLYVSTPLMLSYDQKTIESAYKIQIKALEVGEDLLFGRFNEYFRKFCKEEDEKQKEKDAAELQRIAQELREKQEKERKEREEKEKGKENLAALFATEPVKNIDEPIEIGDEQIETIDEQPDTEDSTENSQESVQLPERQTSDTTGKNALQLAILNKSDLSTFDRVDLYKELKQQIGKQLDGICFVISEDMLSRKLEYRDMSRRQKFRFDEAINTMLAELYKDETQPAKTKDKPEDKKDKQPSKKENQGVNNTYTLDEHPEIKANIDRLMEKADKVEMVAVLKEEPLVLKICYSILRYKKASDKQLKHVNNAISILDNQ